MYYNFALPGDHNIGHIIAGLDPSNKIFCLLPTHFTSCLENPYVNKGIQLCYGKMLESRKNLDFVPDTFLLFLDSIV